MRLRIRVPATTANIGPGFDSLGLALSLYNEFTLEQAAVTSVSGCDEQYRGKDNLFLKAMDYASGLLGKPTPALRLAIDARIPLARGLGSSAAMIVGGVAAAVLLAEGWEGLLLRGKEPVQGRKKLGADELGFILETSAALEGHPDNVTPALYGGFCVAVTQATRGGAGSALAGAGSGRTAVLCSRCEVNPEWRFHALIPPFELQTAKARAALPALLPRADAVFNLGRAALLALAFARKDPALLGAACDDRIHQPYRKALIPGYDEVMAACEEAGAAAVWLSGAGPTLIALSAPGGASPGQPSAGGFERLLGPTLAARPEGAWRMESLAADAQGLSYEFD